MKNYDDEIKKLKKELELEELREKVLSKREANDRREKGERVPVESKNDGGVPDNAKSFTVDGIKFYEIIPYKKYKVVGSSGTYEVIEAKRTGDHLYCNCPQMTYRGFRQNTPCKHEKALAKHLGNIKFDGFKMLRKGTDC